MTEYMTFLTINTEEEISEKKESYHNYKELLHSLSSIRYCKAEVYRNCILGTLRIPQKSEQRGPQISCGFYLTEEKFYLIDDTCYLMCWL